MQSTAFFLMRLNDHVLYLTQIKSTLEDKSDFCGTDHHQCALGQWIYGEGEAQAAAVSDEVLALFKKLIKPHEDFHKESFIAIKAHQAGDIETQELALTELHKLSNTLVSLLLDMDSKTRSNN